MKDRIIERYLRDFNRRIDVFKKSLRRLDARFVFIQSKIGDKFDAGEIGNSLFGVRAFFNPNQPATCQCTTQ